MPPLARLTGDEQRLAEELIICGGNMKKVAEHFDITYPTLRKRLNELIRKVEDERNKNYRAIENTLARIEDGETDPDEGIRRIREIKNGL